MFFFSYILARASFAQERIFLDEQIRFSSKTNNIMYVIPLIYRISSSKDSHISITRLHRAFQSVIMKHSILRTALYLDSNGTILQHCFNVNTINDDMKPYEFSIINLHNDNDCEIDKTINEILNHSNLFDLSKGRVIHCHILRRYHSNWFSSQNDDLLMNDDLILFNIHHSAFDGTSTSIFLRDFSLAYETNSSLPIDDDDDDAIQYIDYSVYEHQMDMTLLHEFWHLQLEGCNLQRPLSLPVDRSRLSIDQRSGFASVFEISFEDDISTSFLDYASSHRITPFQLGLATFYAFLFKLTHGQNDLCIACFNANRYRSELQNMIGMFVATLPYRIQINPHWSFDELVKHVQEKCLSILEHSHYPLQHILNDAHLNQSNVPFLETVFDFITVSSDVDQLCLDGASLQQVSLQQSSEMAKFDFMISFIDNPTLKNGRLACRFVCSCDLFNETTVANIAQRFQHLCFQLFSSKSSATQINRSMKSISNLSLILPKEAEEMQGTIFCRLSNIVNEGMFICKSFDFFYLSHSHQYETL
jgi:Condensation domain